MTDEQTYISPTRYAVFEIDDAGDDRTRVWLRRTATADLEAWAQRKRDRLVELAPGPLGAYRHDLSTIFRPRATPTTLRELRTRLVERLANSGYSVVPDPPIEVYAIELDAETHQGETRVYVGVTSDLERRLAEHAGEIQDGVPAGRAVKRHGFVRYRPDLTEDFAAVPSAVALELEAQVSAYLHHCGFAVHGDGVRRRPRRSTFVPLSWQELIAAHEDAVSDD